MHTIDIKKCTEISGGLTRQESTVMACGLAFVAGGTMSAYVANTMGPLATIIGTPATAVGFGAVCLPFFPVGPILCGFAGAVTGYFLSSSFATLGAFLGGGALSAAGLYQQINKH